MRVSSESSWIETAKKPKKYPKLAKDLKVDILIIGGGLTGIVSFYLLSKLGKKVALIEKNEIGISGATGYTTAFITSYIDTEIQSLIKLFGRRKLKLIWQSGQAAIDLIEKVVRKEKIDCEFTRCSNFAFIRDPKT